MPFRGGQWALFAAAGMLALAAGAAAAQERAVRVHVANTRGNAFVDLLLAGVDVKEPPTGIRKPVRGPAARRHALVSLRIDGCGKPLRGPGGTRVVAPDGRASD